MPTSLHRTIVYGPVLSRRLGVSLGLNLSPTDGKVCTFDCIYCECGLHRQRLPMSPPPTATEVREALSQVLHDLAAEGVTVDSITMAGNGEPTVNPHFPAIMDAVCDLRDSLAPSARISVLTNATRMGVPAVASALGRADDTIAKLDAAEPDLVRLIDRPYGGYDVEGMIRTLAGFEGHLTIQTMFLTGVVGKRRVDNTGDASVAAWLEALRRIRPKAVMVYTIDRATPVETLRKASPRTLDAIADRVRAIGLDALVSY